MLGAFKATYGLGLVSVRVDNAYNVNLQFVETTGRMLCFVEVAALPKDAPKEVCRDLLAGGGIITRIGNETMIDAKDLA